MLSFLPSLIAAGLGIAGSLAGCKRDAAAIAVWSRELCCHWLACRHQRDNLRNGSVQMEDGVVSKLPQVEFGGHRAYLDVQALEGALTYIPYYFNPLAYEVVCSLMLGWDLGCHNVFSPYA